MVTYIYIYIYVEEELYPKSIGYCILTKANGGRPVDVFKANVLHARSIHKSHACRIVRGTGGRNGLAEKQLPFLSG